MATTKDQMVIFDFDGVIVDSISIALDVMQSFNPDLTEEKFKLIFHGNINEHEAKTPTHPKEEFYEKYAPQAEALPIKIEVQEVISQLAASYTLHIVSSAREKIIETLLEIHDLRKYFDQVLGNETHHSKVVKFQSLLDRHNLAPSSSVLITDTLGDIREANEVNVPSIGVLWGLHDQETLQQGNPHSFVSSPSDIPAAVRQVLLER